MLTDEDVVCVVRLIAQKSTWEAYDIGEVNLCSLCWFETFSRAAAMWSDLQVL